METNRPGCEKISNFEPIMQKIITTNEPIGEHSLNDKASDAVEYVSYRSEAQMPDIMGLVQQDLSEPYSVYTYRYFIHNWGNLCWLAYYRNLCVGTIVCKLDAKTGYIAMLVVRKDQRKLGVGSNLVKLAIKAMKEAGANEIVLETEVTNQPALKLYENLGFIRDKRLFRYYLNGLDALRLKLWMV